jgi:hypothetical protein
MLPLLTRRTFFGKCAALLAAAATPGWVPAGCSPARHTPVRGKIMGASAAAGHKLRGDHALFAQPPARTHHCEYVIVGGGVAGLSAARRLKAGGVESFCVLELEEKAGGNASSGHNGICANPWGAHYLPLPNPDQAALLAFLRECGAVTGFDADGVPVYNDYYLCFDPRNACTSTATGRTASSPTFGVPEADQLQIRTFLERMQTFRTARGTDGKYAFNLPVDASSADAQYRALDRITMLDYLRSQGLSSPYLVWYVDYCCRDDYGTTVRDTSAWAGHPLLRRAAGRGRQCRRQHRTHLAGGQRVAGDATGPARGRQNQNRLPRLRRHARRRSGARGLPGRTERQHRAGDGRQVPRGGAAVRGGAAAEGRPGPDRGTAFSIHLLAVDGGQPDPFALPRPAGQPAELGQRGVRRRLAGLRQRPHQHLRSHPGPGPQVVTCYLPLSHTDPVTARTEALARTHAEWVALITADLAGAHPDLGKYLQRVDVWLWGHGMVRPVPGFVWSEARRQAAAPVAGRVFFAHSDLSGISLFEEAFYHGNRAAEEAMGTDQDLRD